MLHPRRLPLPTNVCEQVFCLAGVCTRGPAANGTVCGPATACYQQLCIIGSCGKDQLTGQSCTSTNACLQHTTCQEDGTCGGGTAVVCPPPDQCHTAGTCDLTTGTCSNPAKPDGTACNADNNLCTSGDTCQSGVCVAGATTVCPTRDLCHTAGTCDPTTGVCSAPTLTASLCTSGKVKRGACNCDGTCWTAGQTCMGRPGRRHCQ